MNNNQQGRPQRQGHALAIEAAPAAHEVTNAATHTQGPKEVKSPSMLSVNLTQDMMDFLQG